MGEHARLGLGARLRGSARALGLTCREGQRWRHLRYQRRGFQAPPHPAAPRAAPGFPGLSPVFSRAPYLAGEPQRELRMGDHLDPQAGTITGAEFARGITDYVNSQSTVSGG